MNDRGHLRLIKISIVRRIGLVLVLSLSTACRSPSGPVSPNEYREYPCTLHTPSELTPDFMVRQHVEADAKGRNGGFDAVLQKKNGTLVVIGLVGGVRAFVLKQTDAGISFDQSFGPALPFPPRNILVDIHRAFWKRLPRTSDAATTGTFHGELDGEQVEEHWEDGNLRARVFTRPGEWKGAVRLTYAPGCTVEKCASPKIRIDNEWFSYSITIENGEITPL